MTELEGYLAEILPELKNVSRLFALPENVWEGEQPRFAYRAWEEGPQYHCCFTDGTHTANGSTGIPDDSDERVQALHRKRAARRMVKQAAYRLCKEVTGIHPPWGSSTGVRPTHLLREGLDAGLHRVEAFQRVIDEFDILPEKARMLCEITAVQDDLPAPDDGAMDVYIGIPFCTTRCAYCSFSSGEIGSGKLVEPYLTALFHEMEAGAQLLKDAGKRLRTVYVGGGTPTALNEDQFQRLVDLMMKLYPNALEYTVEAGRPDTITRRKLETIRDAGVGRISINPQTMVDRTLQVIGRAHTAQQTFDAYALAREVGLRHINMDVIAGLPGETLDDFRVTMDAALQLKPESLTVHTLAIKRSSRLHLENAPLPDGDMTAQMVAMGKATAEALGLQPYYLYRQKYMAGNLENTGYALPGHACIYNVDNMEETSHVLALGAGGISKRIYEDEGHIGRAPNVSNIVQYIARVDEMIQRKRELFLSDPLEKEGRA